MALTIKISESSYYSRLLDCKISSLYYDNVADPNCSIRVIASGEELKKCCSILGRDMPFSPSESLLASNPMASAEQLKKLVEKEYTFYGGNAREIVSNWDNWQ